MHLKNKVFLITDASTGVGLATAKLCVERGARVIIGGPDNERLRLIEKELGDQVEAIVTDLAIMEDIEALIAYAKKRCQQIDVLVAIAGVSDTFSVTDIADDTYAKLLDVNCRSAVFTAIYALPMLSEGAAIVFLGSVPRHRGQPSDALYAGNKGFIRSFARSLGSDLSILERGIRVNVLMPGATGMSSTAQLIADLQTEPILNEYAPAKRFQHAHAMAEAVLFLVAQASFITGAELTFDCGVLNV